MCRLVSVQDDSTCELCPAITTSWDRYQNLLYILAVLAAVVAVVYVGLVLLVHFRGGTLTGGAVRMLSLFVWGLQAAQVSVEAQPC